MKRIVIAVDGLTERQREQIVPCADGWAAVEFVPEQQLDWDRVLLHAEVVFGWPAVTAVENSEVRFFQLPSSGYEQYMTPKLVRKNDFRLANARGVTAQAVAEHCLSMMFAFSRQLPIHLRQQKQRLWKRAAHYSLLAGESIAIIGLGAVGRALAERCHALGMQVLAVQRSSDAPDYIAKLYRLNDLHSALRGARHVALTISAGVRNTPLIGEQEFNVMPRGTYFYNMSRGSLVDEEALEAALKDHRLAGAGLDVFGEEPLPRTSGLWDCENVLISPHVGGRFQGEGDALVHLFLENVRLYRARGLMMNLLISNP